MTSSKIFFYFCLSFIAGIFIGSLISIPHNYLWGIVFFNAFLILFSLSVRSPQGRRRTLFKKYKLAAVFSFCLIFILFGILRYQTVNFSIQNNNLKQYNEQKVILAGKILTEPDIRENSVQLVVDVEKIIIGEDIITTLGKVLVKVNKYPEYNYADVLLLSGLLKTPQEFEDFNYKDYLAKKGIFSLMDWPSIEVVEKRNYSNWRQFNYAQILEFKNKLKESIYQNLSPPQSSILGAMVLGDKRKISEEWKEKLNITGLRHITAVSGMHIVILTSILMTFLMGLGFWRRQAFYFTIIFIWLFIIMIGFQPSGIRAGIIGGLFLLGQKLGRLSVSSRAVVMAAAAMLAVNPLLLMFDVGFQLSFLAVLGIIHLGPAFRNWLKFIPEAKFLNLRSIISMTLSAQIFTLPILVYNFGRVSLIAPLTNVLVLPIIYWIMLFGFIFAILGIIWLPLGWIFSLPAWFLLTYLTKIVDLFSHPWASKTIENLHWGWLIVFYLLLGLIVKWFRKKTRLKFLDY